MFLTVINLLTVEPDYRLCFSFLSSLPPFEEITLFLSWITSLSRFCCPSTNSCSSVTQGFFRGERKVLLPHKRQVKPCSQWTTAPNSLIQLQRVPAATHPHHQASSLGSLTLPRHTVFNVLVVCCWAKILGHRGNLLGLEQYLRKLFSDWDGLLTGSQGEVVAHIRGILPRTLVWMWHWWGWRGWEHNLLSSVWVKGGPCLEAEFAC